MAQTISQEERICEFIPTERPPGYLYDIGVGSQSEYATLAKHYPKMKIVGLEPCPITFKNLITKFPGLLLPYGVWQEETNLDLYFSKTSLDAASVFAIGREQNVKIHARTLDSIDEQLGCPEDILLWMDVEGSELMALKGAVKLLQSRRVRWINLAVRDKWTGGTKACIKQEIDEFLIQFGYQEKLQYNHHNIKSEYWRCDAIYLPR